MTTNIIAFLHTTAAYQTAAVQLMVGEANFAAKQLDLHEPLPIVAPANTNQWNIAPPPMGVGGMILTSNYNFDFLKGRFLRISEKNWLAKISPPAKNLDCLTHRISLIDTNEAYQLATQWLARLSVDVGALERKFPPHVAQSETRVARTNQFGKIETVEIPIPVYMVNWSKTSYLIPGMNPVFVKIYGPTKGLLSLGFRGDMLGQIPFVSPPLTVTNATALLGPLPPPDHFVKQLFGGGAAYETVQSPDYVEAWLLNTGPDEDEDGKQTVRVGPKKLWTWTAKSFSNILLDFNSYAWGEMKLCAPDFGLRLRFARGDDHVEFLFCYNCDILEVAHNGHKRQENFDFAHDQLVGAVQSAFPWDGTVGKLKPDPEAKEHRKEYEEMFNQ
jgi:hypothetical protein